MYELVSASNNPLPILLRADIESNCRHMLEGGRVVLDGKGGYRSTFDIRIHCPDSVVTGPDIGGSGSLEVKGDTAYFLNDEHVRSGAGRISADSLVVKGPIHTLVYTRR